MVAERMNEMSVEVKHVTPPCALAVCPMLRGDLEIECLHEELDGTSDDDDILLSGMMFMAFFIVPCCTNSQTTLPGVSCR
jgi:hypothetical protein